MMTPDIIEKLRTQTAGMRSKCLAECLCFNCAVSGLIEVIDEKREEIDGLREEIEMEREY